MQGVKKQHLPSKTCPVCNRPFAWRKKWEKADVVNKFTDEDIDRIIQMAWEDRTPFEAIEFQFGLKEKEVIEFMRLNSKESSFRMWRKRMTGRGTKETFAKARCGRPPFQMHPAA
ncbi:MAG: hypothetical protein RL127_1788 [Bacteroidota bacterium]